MMCTTKLQMSLKVGSSNWMTAKKMLASDSKSFQVTASYLLNLAQRSAELLRTSEEALRSKH